MKSALKIIVMVLPYLFDWIDSWIRERRRKERQEKRDEAIDNPSLAFANHFGTNRVSDKSDASAEAGEADSGD